MSGKSTSFDTQRLPEAYDVFAPDGSEIRILLANRQSSMAHGTLPPGRTSLAVTHKTVEEIWYVLSGQAELWRRLNDREEVVRLSKNMSITIPLGASFQFRTVGDEPFKFIMCTTPPWPGEGEAVRVDDYWPVPRMA